MCTIFSGMYVASAPPTTTANTVAKSMAAAAPKNTETSDLPSSTSSARRGQWGLVFKMYAGESEGGKLCFVAQLGQKNNCKR